MIMKTLQEIISRKDYQRLTVQLKERVEELAVIVRNKMGELDETEVLDYKISEVHANGYSYEYLSCRVGSKNLSLEDINKEYYFTGDFNCKIIGASNKQALEFLNQIEEILEILDEVETKKVSDIQLALNDCLCEVNESNKQ